MRHILAITCAVVLAGSPALAQQKELSSYGDKGYVPEYSATHGRTRRGTAEGHYEGAQSNYPVRSHVKLSDYQCPLNFSGMFRGALYCENGVLMQ